MAIDTGIARLQTGSIKLIHVVELDNYQRFIDDIRETLRARIDTSHPLHPFLTHEISQLQDKLNALKPRNKRSLNFIGSAWKWIAGNPDHDDFEIIQNKMNNVLRNNNKQTIINKLSLDRMNELTVKMNQIIKVVQNDERTQGNLEITKLKYKIEIIKDEIMNLQYAIHWAKVGVINSFILSHEEMKVVRKIFENENIPYLNLEEILEFGEIRIASNGSSLIYIVNIPTTCNESCNKILIEPVKIGKFASKIQFNEIVVCDKQILGIKNKCKNLNKLTICKYNEVEDISESECLPNLIRSKPSNCTLINNFHMATVQEILPGALLLNQFNGTILINREPFDLNGTFLIRFHNETVSANGKVFSSSEITFANPLPAVVQPTAGNPRVEEILNLELIKEMHVNNTEAIELLNIESKIGDVIAYVLVILGITILLSVSLKKSCHTRSSQYPARTYVNASLPLGEITLRENESKEQHITKITQIPYF